MKCKVLVLSPVHPSPPNRGSKIRVHHCVRQLIRRHKVGGLAFSEPGSQTGNGELADSAVSRAVEIIGEARTQWSAVFYSLLSQIPYRSAKFGDSRFRERLRELVSKHSFDLVWVHFLNMLSFLDDSSILDELDGATVVLDQHNDMERFWAPNQSHGTILKRFWAQWNISRIREHREDVLPMCDVILSVSQEDASSTRKLAPSDVPVWVVPNGVDVEHFEYERRKEQESTSNRILFVGSMDVEMNVDAVTWFVQAIFPEIRKSVPDATFVIVGRSPTSDVRAFGENEGVEVTGRVDDLRPYYERADVAIVPSRLGGGTKLKVPEAMAVGVPVVATSKGAQGLEIEDKKHLLIADSEEKFANAVVSLFENPDKASCLATAARERVEEKYSWTGIYDGVLDRIEHRMLRAK